MALNGGDTFAGYTIDRLLGAGAMGEVYLARHPRLARFDAVKILPTALTKDDEYRVRFHREADVAARLPNPHIVGVHDRGEFDGHLWIAMDFVDGNDAGHLLRSQPHGLPTADVLDIVDAIADALDFAHHGRLLHRDVKPANILLTSATAGRRRIVLADFGIARRVDDVGLTATNMAVGTVSYAAPEQLMGQPLDGRADQYALAATAFHLLTGTQLFPGTNTAVTIGKHLTAEPPRLADTRPELAGLDGALRRALAKRPADRFPSCQAFATALRSGSVGDVAPQAPQERAWSAEPPVAVANPFLKASAKPRHSASTGQAKERPPRRGTWYTHPRVIAVMGIVGTVLAVSLAILAWPEDEADRSGAQPAASPTGAPPLPADQASTGAPSPAVGAPQRPAGANPTIADYIGQNGITETTVRRGDPGAPTVTLPVPDGWVDGGARAPQWAYSAILFADPAVAGDPPTITAVVSKLTGNVDAGSIFDYAGGECQNLPGYQGTAGGISPKTLGGFEAFQIGGTYVRDGVKRLIAQKTVVIPASDGDGVYVLQLNANGTAAQADQLARATAVIDDSTTITP